VIPVDEQLERLAPRRIRRSLEVLGRLPDRLAQLYMIGDAKQSLGFGGGGPRITGAGEVADGSPKVLRGGGEPQALGQSAFIVASRSGTSGWMTIAMPIAAVAT